MQGALACDKFKGVVGMVSYYTKHRVLSWKSVCSARGLNGLLGATKRCILSLAVGPLGPLPFTPFVVVAIVSPLVGPWVLPLARGTAEGIIVSDRD